MLTIIIPIIRYSFFVQATLENIIQTAGGDDLDIAFVVPQNVTPEVLANINKCKFHYHFRVIEAPFDAGRNEESLIDYAMRHELMSQWVLVHRCGIFWSETDWYPMITESLDGTLTAICTAQFSSYQIDDDPTLLSGGFFGIYNRWKIIERNLSFQWGKIGTDIPVSPNLRNLIESNRVKRWNESVKIGDWTDSGVCLSLELATSNEECLGVLNLMPFLVHLFGFSQIEHSLHIENQIITSEFPITDRDGISQSTWAAALSCYSYVTSFLFERSEIVKPLPWSLFQPIAAQNEVNTNHIVAACEWIKKFGISPVNPIGTDNCGIQKLVFGTQIN